MVTDALSYRATAVTGRNDLIDVDLNRDGVIDLSDDSPDEVEMVFLR